MSTIIIVKFQVSDEEANIYYARLNSFGENNYVRQICLFKELLYINRGSGNLDPFYFQINGRI